MIVEVSLDRSHDNPQLIFESRNSTGLSLSEAGWHYLPRSISAWLGHAWGYVHVNSSIASYNSTGTVPGCKTSLLSILTFTVHKASG